MSEAKRAVLMIPQADHDKLPDEVRMAARLRTQMVQRMVNGAEPFDPDAFYNEEVSLLGSALKGGARIIPVKNHEGQ